MIRKTRVSLLSVLAFLAFSLSAGAQPVTEGIGVLMEKRVDEAAKAMSEPTIHAMRAPGESTVAARTKINAWIRFNLREAFAQKSKNMEAAIFSFYMARHTLRDSALPFANDGEGNPAPFRVLQESDHAQIATRVWRERIDGDMQAMFDNEFVPGGDLLMMYGIDTAQGPVQRPGQLPRPSIVARTQRPDSRPDALQIRAGADYYELSVPVSRLQMTIPKGGLSQKINPMGGGASSPRYFIFDNVAQGLVVSGWFEPALAYKGAKAVWESDTKESKRRGLPEPQNVTFDKIDNWEVVLYEGGLDGARISNSHVRAHWVQAGTWIDIHLSMTAAPQSGGPAALREKLVALLREIQVKEVPPAAPVPGAGTTPAPAAARP